MPVRYAITGATGYTGKYIARRLLQGNAEIINLTGHPERPNPFGARVQPAAFDFNNPSRMAAALADVDTLFNTYWVRFPYRGMTFERAVENSLALFEAARLAGVRRVVHVSITNPAPDSHLPYFSGKARLEEALQNSGLSYAILRPAVLFGGEDILINNIAYFLRRLPFFAIPGSGEYRLQPIHVEDFAGLCISYAQGKEARVILDAIGPETFTFNELVHLLAKAINRQPRLIHLPPDMLYPLMRILGAVMKDIVLTRQEIQGLMADLLVTQAPVLGKTSLSTWAFQNADSLGRNYASEVARHFH
ncbi:MAG: hypothetical protein Fur0018_17230 [Anaerolineales bacterium]